MKNLHNTSPPLPTTDVLVQLAEDGGDRLHALWSICTVRLEVFTWKSGKIVAKPVSRFTKSSSTVKFACDGVRFCAVDVQVDRRSYSTKPLHGRGSPLDRGRFPLPIARGRCGRSTDVAAIDETLTNRLWKMSRSPELNWQPRSASETAAWSSCRAVILGIVEMQRRWSAHTSASGWPCIGGWAVDDGRSDLAPSRCGRRIVVMLWSPSVHLPAAVTDCHDPLDMDGSIICLLISSTGVLDSYIARLVSCVSMEADKSSALIDEKLAANFYTTLTASAIQLVTALGKG
ncbi:hypothetical protein T01_2163 [Trichinella spiralis]|uniref:Uncharacterized protein n=1 Tax=Trichinella spiralis TaxID=6334 RepID=A0A0V1B196_TRISP|nr:hypothetical protein T01_2163 [Trichinella spiralis]